MRIESDDLICWENLGLAYSHSGKYTAALKAFGRALELDPTSVYSIIESGRVQHKLRMFPEAIIEFDKALLCIPNHQPTIRYLMSSLYAYSIECHQLGAFGRAVDQLCRGLKLSLNVGILLESSAVCKQVGDLAGRLVEYAEYAEIIEKPVLVSLLTRFDEYEALYIVKNIIGTPELPSQDYVISLSARLSYLAYQAAVSNAVKEAQSNDIIASYWADTGLSLLKLSEFFPEPAALRNSATACLFTAIQLDDSEPSFWNALASVIHDRDPHVTQHCLIQAIEMDSKVIRIL